ncbi:MAG TPA: SEC-C metal-binding domain-containing protein, partial [Actinomycetes bacterium]|nr:SEC-C metal-binding domain-containing protein [Actinomycetes bacterium]
AWPDALEKATRAVAAEHDEVVELGGLYVLGTERHESRRIDNQLRGRSGRQGDPGESRVYLSLQDDLMRLFKSNDVDTVMTRFKVPDDVPIEAKMVTNAIASAQHQVEQQHFEIRKNVLKYDEVLNRQRQVIYAERRRVLEGADLHEQVRHMLDDVTESYVAGATSDGFPEEWDLDALWTALRTLYPISFSVEEAEERAGGDRSGLTRDFLIEEVRNDVHAAYDQREEELSAEVTRELERRVVLSVLDRKWREHLYEMDYLQEGIGLRAMAQRDPLVEYQREGYDLFAAMMDGIKEESVGFLFNVEVQQPQAAAPANAAAEPAATATESSPTPPAVAEPETDGQKVRAILAKGLGAPSRPTNLQYSAPTVDGAAGVQRRRDASADGDTWAGVSRNDPCPCGSGRKYKRCHGDPRARATSA